MISNAPVPRRRRSTAVRRLALLVAGASLAAACSSGKSVLESEAEDEPAETAADVEVAGSGDTAPDTTGDAASGSDVASTDGDDAGTDTAPQTTAGPTTTVAPLADQPPCPVEALDEADGPVTITMWYGLGNEIEVALRQLADEYNASQDRVVVELQNQTSYESTIDKYVQASESNRPDVVQFPEYVVQALAQSGTFVPVQACIEASGYDTSTFLPRALDTWTFEGIRWGLPFNVSSPVLYYNRKMFEAAGLDPDDPPITLEELRAAAQALVDSGAAAVGLVLDSGRDSGGGWYLEQWLSRMGAPYADNGNGRLAPATEVLFNSEEGAALLQYLQDLIDDGYAATVGDNPGGQDALLKMIDQQSPGGMVVGTSAALSSAIAVLGSGIVEDLTPDDFGIGPMPGPSPEPAAQVGGAALWLPVTGDDAATAAAWDFVQFMVSAQSQSTWTAGTGYVPVRSDAVELDPIASLFEEDPRFRVSYDQILAAAEDPTSYVPALGPHREIRAQTADAVASVYAGADPQQALDEAAAIADTLIANYNATVD